MHQHITVEGDCVPSSDDEQEESAGLVPLQKPEIDKEIPNKTGFLFRALLSIFYALLLFIGSLSSSAIHAAHSKKDRADKSEESGDPYAIEGCPPRKSCIDSGFVKGSWLHRNRTSYYSRLSDPYYRDIHNKRLDKYHKEHPEQNMDYLPWNQYDWKTDDSCCTFESFNRFEMCKTLKRLNIKKMLIVGDSLSGFSTASFSELMQATRKEKGGMAPFYACGPDNDDFSFHFISSLRLNPALKTVAEEFSDRPKKEVWQQTSWTAHLGDVDLVLINSGAWWVDVNLFKNRMEEVFQYLDANYTGLVIFRTTPRGHPNCGAMEQFGPANDTYHFEHEEPPSSPFISWWDHFPSYNQAVRDIVSTLQRPPIILDVEPMTRLRVDGHVDGKFDCLHYRLPGVIDWWNIYFYNVLRSLEHKSDKPIPKSLRDDDENEMDMESENEV